MTSLWYSIITELNPRSVNLESLNWQRNTLRFMETECSLSCSHAFVLGQLNPFYTFTHFSFRFIWKTLSKVSSYFSSSLFFIITATGWLLLPPGGYPIALNKYIISNRQHDTPPYFAFWSMTAYNPVSCNWVFQGILYLHDHISWRNIVTNDVTPRKPKILPRLLVYEWAR